jgi:serine/alanine adding enzyme
VKFREYLLTTYDRALWHTYMPETRSVYGSLGYAELCERHLARSHRLYVVESNDGWIAHPMLFRSLSGLPFHPIAGSHWDITTPEYTGPQIFGDTALSAGEYLRMRHQLAWQEGIVAEFAHVHPWNGAHSLLSDGTVYNRDIIWIDTTLDPDFLWRNHLEYRCRKCLSKAQREGLFTIEATTDGDIAEFTSIYEATMERNQALPGYYFSPEYFRAFRDAMPDTSRFILTLYRDRVIGALLALFDDENVYAYLGGSDINFHHLHPASFQIWDLIRWAHMTGRARVVLGAGYTHDDGIFKFKAAFSPLRKAFYIYKKIHNLDAYAALERAHRAFNGLTEDEVAYFPSYRYVRPKTPALESALQSR